MTRSAHFVGSLPGELGTDELTTLRWFADASEGQMVTAIPCDSDPNWMIAYLIDVGQRGPLELVRPGQYRDYGDMPQYRIRRGHTLTADDVSMRRTARFARVMSAMKQLQTERPALAGTKVQLSQPNPLDVALFTLGGGAVASGLPIWKAIRAGGAIASALAALPTFTTAVLAEIEETTRKYSNRIVWQVETPVAMLGCLKAHELHAARAAVPVLAKQLADFLIGIHRVGGESLLHLCFGDYQHTQLLSPRDLTPAVALLNAVAQRLQAAGAPLPAAHIPCAYGSSPAPTSPRFYQPLANLEPGWPLIAGVAAPGAEAASTTALQLFEDFSGREAFAVATACGFGRRTPDDARRAAATTMAISRASRHAQAA